MFLIDRIKRIFQRSLVKPEPEPEPISLEGRYILKIDGRYFTLLGYPNTWSEDIGEAHLWDDRTTPDSIVRHWQKGEVLNAEDVIT